MKIDKNTLAQMRALCAELDPEDGLTPAELQRLHRQRRRVDRKIHQLCGQVARALNLSLPAAADPVLRRLLVRRVEPPLDGGRMLAVVEAPADVAPALALRRLRDAHGWLRAEVAAGVNRKTAPDWTWLLIAGEVSDGR